MKKQSKNEKDKQIAEQELDFVKTSECDETAKEEKFRTGAEVTVKPEITRFCDGRGIPSYARRAFIKRYNPNGTVLIESAPDGKELGLLLASQVDLA